MNKNWVITIAIIVLIIVGIVIANKNVLGYSNSFQIFKCESNWMKIPQKLVEMPDLTPSEFCKIICYNNYKVNFYKLENTVTSDNISAFYCYCDVNNCK